MGMSDQFKDKANELKDRAQKAAQGAKDEASERARQLKDKKTPSRSPQQSQDPTTGKWDDVDGNF